VKVTPELYRDHLIKEKVNGKTLFTFIDTLGMRQAQGGFVWVEDNVLYIPKPASFNVSSFESIYKFARLR
jgi:hypothetical protein